MKHIQPCCKLLIMKKIVYVLTILLAAFTAISCNSLKEITPDLTATQIMQYGQEAYSSGNYEAADYYYTQTLIRFGMDTAIYVEARYEIGHIALKTKDYEKAYRCFKEIIEIYQSVPAGSLNPSFRTLSEKGMDKIPADVLEKLKK